MPVEPPPGGRPWWKGPVGIVVGLAAVIVIVVGVILVATSGGDTKESTGTDPDDTEVTAPDRTDSDTTRPRRTTTVPDTRSQDTTDETTGDTDVPFTVPPLTDPPRSTPINSAPATTGVRPTSTSTASTAQGAVPIGQTISSGSADTGVQITVLDVVDNAPVREFSEPDPGNKLVAVKVHIANLGTTGVDVYGGIESKLIDTSGQQFSRGFATAQVGPPFNASSVPAHDVRSGWLTFELPEAAVPARFQWEIDDLTAEWDLVAAPQTPGELRAATAPEVPIGTAATVTGTDDVPFEITVAQVVDNATPTFGSPEAGNRLVAVQVTYHNTGSAAIDEYPEINLELIDVDGQQYTSSFIGSSAGPGFDGEVKLTPGDTRTGFITFEVLADVGKLKLSSETYETDGGGALSMLVM